MNQRVGIITGIFLSIVFMIAILAFCFSTLGSESNEIQQTDQQSANNNLNGDSQDDEQEQEIQTTQNGQDSTSGQQDTNTQEDVDEFIFENGETHRIINTFNMESRYFTQGLSFINYTHILLSSGQYGRSQFGIFEIQNTQIKAIKNQQISANYFGEGSVIFQNKLYMLTWRRRKVILANPDTLAIERELDLPSGIKEGWGLSHDNTYLVISDGTSKIYYVDHNSFTVVSSISVVSNGVAKSNLNEIEVVGDYIYSNIWLSDIVLKINKHSGVVEREYVMVELKEIQQQRVQNEVGYDWGNNVLNGIAYREESDTFFLTGKNWDYVFEMKLRD